ncbi:MAG: HAD family hydrolase [Eubacteriales bacterium]
MEIKNINAVIFDLDGTLLDTLEDLKVSLNIALGNKGFPPRTKEEVRTFVGNGIPKLIERALPAGIDEKTREKVYLDFMDHYSVHYADNTIPYDGVFDFITRLKANGIKTGVVSNKADNEVKKLCDKFFPGLIDIALGLTESTPKKPSPDMIFKGLEYLECPNDRAIFIGDSEVDIQTAANTGVPLITVCWGFRDRETLIQNGAKVIVSNTHELEKLFFG